MAKAEKKSAKAAAKIKKKIWFAIVSPKFLGERQIGESYLEEPELALKRTVKANLMQITGDVKSQSSELRFVISGFKDNRLETRITGYQFSSAAIRRFIRRHMTRIDDSLVILTSDGQRIRIKPFLLTRNKVTKSVEKSLRITLREELINFVKKTTYENLFTIVIKYQLQKELKEKLSKVYPVKSLEIRVLEEETHHSAKETEMPVKKPSKKVKSKKDEKIEEEEHRQEQEASEPEDVQAETPEKKAE